jgi:preprotein translocase subunit SecE
MNKITQYVNEVQQELAKVSWPTRDELIETTMVVLVICAICSAFVFTTDVILSRILGLVLKG